MFSLKLDGWRLDIRFSSAHLLPGHKKCGILHGHTYAIHAKVYGEKDEHDFILDLSLLKSTLRKISERLDHRILIPEKNEYFVISNNEVRMKFDNKKYVFPKEDCVFLPIKSVTAENLAEYILDEMLKIIKIPKNVKRLEIGVDEGFGQGAWAERVVG